MTTGVIYGVRPKAIAGVSQPAFYVGQTRQKPKQRWRQHTKSKYAVGLYMEMLGGPGEFEMYVIEQVPVEHMDARERFWIKELRTMAPRGLNLTDGGSRSNKHKSVREKASRALRETYARPEKRLMVRARNKANWQDPEYRARTIRAKRESVKDPEYLAKLGASRRRAWAEPGAKDSIRAKTKAQWADPEQRALKSARIRETLNSPEYKAKRAAKKKFSGRV